MLMREQHFKRERDLSVHPIEEDVVQSITEAKHFLSLPDQLQAHRCLGLTKGWMRTSNVLGKGRR